MAEERFKPLELDEMPPAMRAAAEGILKGPRKGMRGPFKAMLRSPGLAEHLQRVGEHVRFHSAIPDALKELAIILTARHWTAQFEWYAHRKLALEAGLAAAICDAVAAGKRPAAMSADETIVYDFASSLLAAGEVSDAQFKAVADRFGERGVIDLIGTIGYYTTVSFILNVDRVSLPADATPLKPLHK